MGGILVIDAVGLTVYISLMYRGIIGLRLGHLLETGRGGDGCEDHIGSNGGSGGEVVQRRERRRRTRHRRKLPRFPLFMAILVIASGRASRRDTHLMLTIVTMLDVGIRFQSPTS